MMKIVYPKMYVSGLFFPCGFAVLVILRLILGSFEWVSLFLAQVKDIKGALSRCSRVFKGNLNSKTVK